MNNKNLVPALTFSKSNYLVQARYNYNLICNQVLAYCLCNAKKIDGIYTVEFSVSDIKQYLNKDNSKIWNTLKDTADRMNSTRLCIKNPKNNDFAFYQLIPTFTYEKGYCTVKFNKDLNHIVGNLTENFTVLNLETLSKLDNVNAFRLYETLKSKAFYDKYEKKENKNGLYIKEFPLSEIKVLLNAVDINRSEIRRLMEDKEDIDYDRILRVAEELYEADKDKNIPTADKYKKPKWDKFKDFNRVCLKPAIDEINSKTEFFVEVQPVPQKNVKKLVFYITDKSYIQNNKDNIVSDDLVDIDDLVDEVRAFFSNEDNSKTSTKEIKTLINAADNNINLIHSVYDYACQKGCENFMGFMLAGIKNGGYKDSYRKEKANSFNQYEQRDIDFDELERMFINKF